MTETAAAPVRLSPGDPAPDFTLPDADGPHTTTVVIRWPARVR